MNLPIIISGVILLMTIALAFFMFGIHSRQKTIETTLSRQYAIMVKIQALLKSKQATNAVAENAEIVYQDLLQNLIPIMAALDIMPRQTNEHPLWRAIGGILDEYAKNPFVLENMRRSIKLDANILRSVENYIARADKFLAYLNTTDDNGILSATFTDGMLGQSMTFFAQARQLANSN